MTRTKKPKHRLEPRDIPRPLFDPLVLLVPVWHLPVTYCEGRVVGIATVDEETGLSTGRRWHLDGQEVHPDEVVAFLLACQGPLREAWPALKAAQRAVDGERDALNPESEECYFCRVLLAELLADPPALIPEGQLALDVA